MMLNILTAVGDLCDKITFKITQDDKINLLESRFNCKLSILINIFLRKAVKKQRLLNLFLRKAAKSKVVKSKVITNSRVVEPQSLSHDRWINSNSLIQHCQVSATNLYTSHNLLVFCFRKLPD